MLSEFNTEGYQLAIPETFEVPRDQLEMRLDFYSEMIIAYLIDDKTIHTKIISPDDLVLAIMSRYNLLRTDLLPENTLWWVRTSTGYEVALWRGPRVWKVALQEQPFKPARRFKLPMPGLIFICSPGQPPAVYAAKERPKSVKDKVYHAPLFNLFSNGSSCPGTHHYPQEVEKIPESFFSSFFTPTANHYNRSLKYPHNLLALWEEINNQPEFPVDDLVEYCTVNDLMRRQL